MKFWLISEPRFPKKNHRKNKVWTEMLATQIAGRKIKTLWSETLFLLGVALINKLRVEPAKIHFSLSVWNLNWIMHRLHQTATRPLHLFWFYCLQLHRCNVHHWSWHPLTSEWRVWTSRMSLLVTLQWNVSPGRAFPKENGVSLLVRPITYTGIYSTRKKRY